MPHSPSYFGRRHTLVSHPNLRFFSCSYLGKSYGFWVHESQQNPFPGTEGLKKTPHPGTEVRRIGMCQSLHSQMKGCRNHFLDLQLSPCLPCYCCLLAYWLFVGRWIKSRDWKEVTHWRRGRKTDTEKVIQGQHHADLWQDTFPNVPTTRSLTDDPVAWPRDGQGMEKAHLGDSNTQTKPGVITGEDNKQDKSPVWPAEVPSIP